MLLGHYAASSGNFYRRFGQPIGPNFKGQYHHFSLHNTAILRKLRFSRVREFFRKLLAIWLRALV
jgi:hypothetical protein